MTYKTFLFRHFLIISFNLALLQLPSENLFLVSGGFKSPPAPTKNGPNLHDPPSPKNMTTIIRQHTVFPFC